MGFIIYISRYALPILAVVILALCSAALLRRKPQSLGNVSIAIPQTGDVYPLTSRETSIGRHKNCDIIVNYPSVSRQHAVVICGKDGWYITEINRSSPVYINGKRIEKSALLKTGDRIKLGDITLLFDNNSTPVKSGGKQNGK